MKLHCCGNRFPPGVLTIWLIAANALFFCRDASAQTSAITLAPVITTIAGNGTAGFGGDGGPAINGSLNGPTALAVDAAGNLYIADAYSSRVRKVDRTGTISTVAGNGNCSFSGDGGPSASAMVCQPYGLATDRAGNIYIADTYNHRIRKIDANSVISTIAGNGTAGFSGDGGPATSATVNSPTGLAVDGSGNIYIADRGNYRVRKINSSGIISTIAGSGSAGYGGDGGPAVNAAFNTVWGVEPGAAGNIYVTDVYNTRVRKIDTSGIITAIVGGSYGFSGDGGSATNAQLSNPYDVTVDASGNVYIADTYNNRVRKINTSGTITTIAGTGAGSFSGDGGAPTSATINNPYGVAVDAMGNVYIADTNNQRIRKLQASISPFGTIDVGQSSAVQSVYLSINQALTISSISIPGAEGGTQEYIAGSATGCFAGSNVSAGTTCAIPITFKPAYAGTRQAPLTITTSLGTFTFGLNGVGRAPQVGIVPGIINSVAGNGETGFSGDSGPALAAALNAPQHVARDAAGNMYIATFDNRIRKVSPGGTITTIAGNGGTTYGGDNGPAIDASFVNTSSVALDGAGNLYVADAGGQRVRKVHANGTITTVAGNGTSGSSGDGGLATNANLNQPIAIAVDTNGNLFISDAGNHRVREVDVNGIINTIAGTGVGGYGGDNGPAANALLNSPQGLAFDAAGNLYVADRGNVRIRKIAASGVITTVAGGGSASIPVSGTPAIGAAFVPYGIAVDAGGNIYIADAQSPALLKVDSAAGTIRIIAGIAGSAGFSGDGGPATSARLDRTMSVALDSYGNVYLADSANNRVREVSIAAAPVSFPDTSVGQISSVRTIYLSNIGNADLTGGGAVETADFLTDPSGTCFGLTTLPAGTSCSLAMLFSPQQVGLRTGTITLTDNALNVADSTQQVALSGNGQVVGTTTWLGISTANHISFGTPVTMTADVTPYSGGTVTASGTITFYDGTIALGPAQAISSIGSATITIPSFSVATHSLTAVYSGDPNFGGSSSVPSDLTVVASATVLLTSSKNPSIYGDNVTFAATVTGVASGSVQFLDDGVSMGSPVPIVNNVAIAAATATLARGSHLITATYTNSVTQLSATIDTLTQIVLPATLTVTATSLTRAFSLPNPDLTYTISGLVNGETSAVIAGVPIVATSATSASAVGSYRIAVGIGSLSSSNYTFQLVNGSLIITKATPGAGGIAAVTLTSSVNPSVWGQPVTLTAMLPPNATGQVSFMEGGVLLGTSTIAGNVASISGQLLSIGTHSITAVYAGDGNYNGASSVALMQIVGKTTLAVIANDAERIYGQANPVFTWSFSGFVNGDTSATVIGAPILTTTATPISPAGTYIITAAPGTLASSFYVFDFIKGTLLIAPATPGIGPTQSVAIASSLNPAPSGAPVVLTANVPPGATGTVSFLDDTAVVGTAAIAGNTASITTSTLAPGTHLITAIYSGDANYTTASSARLSQVVAGLAADFAMTSAMGGQLIPPGASATYTILVSSVGAPFTTPVTMSASNLPPGANYAFNPTAVTPGVAGANSTLTIRVPGQNAASRPGPRTPLVLALLLLPLATLRRMRRRPMQLLFWLVVTLTAFGTAIGCGAGGYFSQSEQTYTVTVTGSSGSVVRTTTVSLTVQ